MIILLILVICLKAVAVSAATYYVATTGSDANNGSSGSPWRNPQKCFSSGSPLVPGDICEVLDGTYTAATGVGQVVRIISTSPQGASGNPIILRAANLHGATIEAPNTITGADCAGTASCTFAGIYISNRNYITIEGFQFTRPGSVQGTNSALGGISVVTAATGITIRYNHFHDIGRNVCSNSTLGNVGIFALKATNMLIEKNTFNTIGRRINGENGCSTTIFAHDHAIYIDESVDLMIRRNICYDTTRGFCVNLKSRGTGVKTLRAKIYNNTFSGDSLSTSPRGHLSLVDTFEDLQIKNNIFNDPEDGYVIAWHTTSQAIGAGINIQYNLTNSTRPEEDFDRPLLRPSSGLTKANNLMNTSPGFTNAAGNDFTLATGSTAINAGTNVGLPFNGSAPDIGVFETFTFASCQVPSTAASTIQITFTNNVNPPIGSTITTFTARLNGASNALTGAATRIGDNIASLPLTTIYVAGNTADISWSSGGLTDQALIGGYLNQPFIQTLSNQSCANNAGGAPAYAFRQAAFEFHAVPGTESSPKMKPDGYPSTGEAENFDNYKVVLRGKIRIRFAVVCDVADCADTGFYLYGSHNGGGYAQVLDSFGAEHVAFCGATEQGLPNNGAPTTNQLSTSGTFVPGGLLLTSHATPTISGLNNGYKTELEYCVAYDAEASGFYDYRLYTQTGSPLAVYDVTPRNTIIGPQASGAF